MRGSGCELFKGLALKERTLHLELIYISLNLLFLYSLNLL
jgi:hypothetical protein